MDQWHTVTQRLARSIPELSPRLRKIARYVLEHQGDVATLSMPVNRVVIEPIGNEVRRQVATEGFWP